MSNKRVKKKKTNGKNYHKKAATYAAVGLKFQWFDADPLVEPDENNTLDLRNVTHKNPLVRINADDLMRGPYMYETQLKWQLNIEAVFDCDFHLMNRTLTAFCKFGQINAPTMKHIEEMFEEMEIGLYLNGNTMADFSHFVFTCECIGYHNG